ncbi:putative selenate ABC transporter substrate-binding protein [Ketobacter sp.]|uniref:putative selenate ABC transporter substrate-binding protein n=1 Tax=Ketobacter sp. TaxID=2083498 RepID=UPI0026D52999|nr:putative selenate ABC transporter substrate-binding protein [Ketobacter sp.]
MLMLRRLLALLLLFPTLALAETFVFTAIPDQDESQLQQRFDKVARYLAAQLNTEQQKIEVRYIPVKSYAAAITAFRNNQVQLAWFGGLSGVQARRLVPGSEALAQGFEDQYFKSYIIAHHSAGIAPGETLPDSLKGKTFTFGSKGSTSGRLMPEFYLREHFQAAPEAIFSKVGFSGDHSQTIAQVQAGAYQVGAVNYSVWDTELAEGKIDPAKVKVIWTTPTYPDYQWTVRGDVDQHFGAGFKARLRDALLNMKDPDLLASFPRQSFVPASNADYAPIEDTAKAIGLLDE